MIRGQGAAEDEEAAMQGFLFKVNVALFFGSIIAIRTGDYLLNKFLNSIY